MAKIVPIIGAAVLALCCVAACSQTDTSTHPPQAKPDEPKAAQTEDESPIAGNKPGGVGMTYTGKVGVDLGGGLILTPKGLELGFGF